MQRIDEKPFWPDLVRLKDTMSLRELADRFAVSPSAISYALKRNGLSRVEMPPGPRALRGKPDAVATGRRLDLNEGKTSLIEESMREIETIIDGLEDRIKRLKIASRAIQKATGISRYKQRAGRRSSNG